MSDLINIVISNSEFELASKPAPKAGGPNFLLPGQHNVKIVEVGEQKENMIDKTWKDVNITVENEAGKRSYATVCIPTSKLSFGNRQTFTEFGKLRNLILTAFGEVEVTGEVLNRTVNDPAKLKGKSIRVEVGYTRAHSERQKNGTYILTDGKKQFGGEFAGYAEAEAFAIQNNIKYQKFPKVINFVAAPSVIAEDEEFAI